uniref:Uncharacterized protein n=1 Tax=Lepeophtheirus salmonis TaxID=72036 RepID=A0A0K2U3Y5_LEPSM
MVTILILLKLSIKV